MLRGGQVRAMYELKGKGQSIRGIARELGISRNTVRKYLRASEIPKAKPRPRRGSKLDPYKEYPDERLSHGVDNCVVLLREIRERGYTGGCTILKDYVAPSRQRRNQAATMRYETEPGEQMQVDFGRYTYRSPDGKDHSVWAFVMILSWSRSLYVEFVERADTATFLRCHIHGFEHFGGVPQRCLYDNTKLVVLRRDREGRPVWNERFIDFSAVLGFEPKLCRPYRAQTKGKVERGVGYVEGNFWPGARFVDLADLNRQAMQWIATVADVCIHGTTHERPVDRFETERAKLMALPDRSKLQSFLRDERTVGRDGYVRYGTAWYGVPWRWAGCRVQVAVDGEMVSIFSGQERLALHPRAQRQGQRFTVPGQWSGLPLGHEKRRRSPVAFQVGQIEVEQRSLWEYATVAEEVIVR